MEITDKVADFAQETGDTVSKAAKSLGSRGDNLKKAEQRLLKDCCNYISHKPLKAMGIAVASGFLLSRVLGGR